MSDRRERSIDFARADGPRRVRLRLDPAHMTQRIMLEYLDAGRLYEQETTSFLAAVLRDGDAMLDVGAHVGWFSLFAAHCVGPRGAVWSFEPDDRNFAHLVEHVAINGVPHVHPMHMAVARTPATAHLLQRTDNDGGHALATTAGEADGGPVTYVAALDDLFPVWGGPPLRLVKIDAEGAELDVLRGAERLLTSQQVPFVVAEINAACLARFGTDEFSLRDYMASLGYETTFFHPTESRLLPVPPGESIRSEVLLNYCFRRPGAMT